MGGGGNKKVTFEPVVPRHWREAAKTAVRSRIGLFAPLLMVLCLALIYAAALAGGANGRQDLGLGIRALDYFGVGYHPVLDWGIRGGRGDWNLLAVCGFVGFCRLLFPELRK